MTSSGCGGTPGGTRWPPPSLARVGRAGRHLLDAVLAVTLAPTCAACARILDSPLGDSVCARCWAAIRPVVDPICPVCGVPQVSGAATLAETGSCGACRRRPSAVDWGRVAAHYSGPLRDVIHAFKYEGRRSLARPLGHLLAQAGASVLNGADCVVAVPLHPWKRLRRGFNQAADLAAALGPPVVPALWRVRATRAQVGLSAATRRRNVRAAFVPSLMLRVGRRAGVVANRVVVLVDDVRTTGATLHECATVLKRMGAREVRSLALAQAPARESRP